MEHGEEGEEGAWRRFPFVVRRIFLSVRSADDEDMMDCHLLSLDK